MTDIVFKGVRMVQGNPLEKQTKDFDGNPILDRTTGQPSQRYFFAVAIPKTDPQWAVAYAIMQQVAQAGFPAGQHTLPDFSWKFVDGDEPKYAAKPGFPGHWILRCSQTPPIKVCKKSGPGRYEDINDKDQSPTGYYINVLVNIAANGRTTKYGNYVNPRLVEVVAAGEIILGGPNPEDAFGGDAPALPVGATALPAAVVPALPALPAAVVPALPAAVVPALPAAVVPALPALPAAVVPALPALPAAVVPALPAAVVPALPAAVVPHMTAKTGGATYEQMKDAGWTDERMISEGYMINTKEGVIPSTTILGS